MHAFVTGAAGFIGSNLVDRLLARGDRVTGYDNFSTGLPEFLTEARGHPGFALVDGDLLDTGALGAAMRGCDFVFHLAANADVRFGTEHPSKDLEQNTIATFNVLEAMRASGIGRIAFSSTGSVYGESTVVPTPEDAPFPVQTSLYGASKLAGEGYTHGHVFDFYKKLLADPSRLPVLGNGRQKKSYLYVGDCIDAIFLAVERAQERVNVLNLGVDGYVEVTQSIEWITRRLGLSPRLEFAGGERGWIGDSPLIYLDTAKIRGLGWRPKLTIEEGIVRTVDWLAANRWVLERRA
jgi:UDP-glucose 4-epimerase